MWTPDTVKKAICAFYYGDDSYIICPLEWKLSSQYIFKYYRHLGLEATHCVKDFPVDQEVPVEQLTFLKRTIGEDDASEGRVVAKLPIEVVEDMLSYTSKKNKYNTRVIAATISNMLAEAHKHGEAEFTRIAKTVKLSLRTHNIDVSVSWEFTDYAQGPT